MTTEPQRPARPATRDARVWNAHVGQQVEERLTQAKALLEEAMALAQDVVTDVDDIAKETVVEVGSIVKGFLANLDLMRDVANGRKARLAAKIAEMRAASQPAPE